MTSSMDGLLSKAPYGVYAVDMSQTILFWNRSAEWILGHTAEEAVGLRCYEVLQSLPESGTVPVCLQGCPAIRLAREGRVPSVVNVAARCASGARKHIDGVVYFSSWDGQIDALKASTGDPLWHYKRECGVFSFPVAEGGVVYVGSTDEHLYALDAFTGELRWRNAMGTSLFSSPALVEGAVYIGSPDGYVYALDASTGGSLWRSRADDHP